MGKNEIIIAAIAALGIGYFTECVTSGIHEDNIKFCKIEVAKTNRSVTEIAEICDDNTVSKHDIINCKAVLYKENKPVDEIERICK